MRTQREETLQSNPFELGKLPPQSTDLEKAVLGALLIDKDSFYLVATILTDDMFYEEKHKLIYRSIVNLVKNNAPVDILTVSNDLRKEGNLDLAGGAFYISELTNTIASSANIEYHARIISQKAIARNVILIASKAITKAYDETIDIFETIDELGNGLVQINTIVNGANEVNWKKETEKTIMDIIEKSKQGITSTGERTGLEDLDNALAGIRGGLYIVGGRPSMGKTAFALDLTMRLLNNSNGHIGFFSLEMPTYQLINRIIARETGINQTRLINCNIYTNEHQFLIEKGGEISKLNLLINDNPNISILQIQSQAKVWANKYNLKGIFVDYLQLVKGSSPQRYLEVGEVSRGLKVLSNILGIPIIALAQLGREDDKGKSLPALRDLRESGNIEQDADTIMFLYRPEYYGINEDANGHPTQGLTMIIIPKNKNGAVNNKGINLKSDLAINRYSNWGEVISTSNVFIIEKSMNNIRATEFQPDDLPF